MKCPHCGNEHPDGAGFCPTTGQPIITSTNCPFCGQTHPEGAKFCPVTGKELAPEQEIPKTKKHTRVWIGFILLFGCMGIITGMWFGGDFLASRLLSIPEIQGITTNISPLILTNKPKETAITTSTLLPTQTSTPTSTPSPTLTSSPTLTPTATPVFSWSKSVVESSSNRPGPFLSMDIASDGTFYLAYFLDRNDELKIVKGNGKSWNTLRNLTQLRREGKSIGFYVNLDLDNAGTPYLSYLIPDKSMGRGVYLKTNGTWSTAAIGENLDIFDMRVQLDTTGVPHYGVLAQNGDVLYRTSGTNLTKISDGALPPNSVEINFRYFPIALAVDSSQNPYICFYKSNTLQCGYNSGNSWNILTVAPNGIYPSLQIDELGNLHLAYYDYVEKSLNYGFLPVHSSEWSIDIVDSTGNTGWYPSLKVDANGLVHISYYDADNTSLKYALGRMGGWSTYTVDNDGNVGLISSLVIDSQNNPAIAYFDSDGRNIWFVAGQQR